MTLLADKRKVQAMLLGDHDMKPVHVSSRSPGVGSHQD